MPREGMGRKKNVACEMVRAAEGERMWVLLNHVKADKWEQHERFVHHILMPAVEKVDPSALPHTVSAPGRVERGRHLHLCVSDGPPRRERRL
jgi:hypothetical protein